MSDFDANGSHGGRWIDSYNPRRSLGRREYCL